MSNNISNINLKYQVTTLPRPIWLMNAGMSTSIGHDRQSLGIILSAGQTIRVRQINPLFKGCLVLRLLNDDRNTETTASIQGDWIEISAKAASVVFIDTPYGEVAPEIEYEYPATAKTLPVYRKGQDERAFFELWDSQNAEFALIESNDVSILVPSICKSKLKSLAGVSNIDGLIGYYQNIFIFFNRLAGLSFDAKRVTDRNIRSRYFLKADQHGNGAAYYSYHWTAQSNASIDWLWLEPKPTNWGSLHEIAHGYQGSFMYDPDFRTNEVWNNIYAAFYQSAMLKARKYKEGWLYSPRQASVEEKIAGYISGGTPLNAWDVKSKLYFIVMMLESASIEAFIYFNQQYRLKSNTPGFVQEKPVLLDMLSESCATAGHRVDVTPFIQAVKGYMTPMQRERNLFNYQASVVCSLNQLVQGDVLWGMQALLDLPDAFSLVNARQLDGKGNVTFSLSEEDLNQIRGERLVLSNGANYTRELVIDSGRLECEQLPIGIYALAFLRNNEKKIQASSRYVVVKSGDNQHRLSVLSGAELSLLIQEIRLQGLGNSVFAKVRLNLSQRLVTIDIISTNPHHYFSNQTYAHVVVRDKDNQEKFRQIMPGVGAVQGHTEIPISEDDTIEIYHSEPSRLVGDMFDNSTTTHILRMTEYGLVRDAWNTQLPLERQSFLVLAALKQQLSFQGNVSLQLNIDGFNQIQGEKLILRSGPNEVHERLINSQSIVFDQLPIGVYSLWLPTGKDKKYQIQNSYVQVKPGDNQHQVQFLPKTISSLLSSEIALRGLGENIFATVGVDVPRGVVKIAVTLSKPHSYFANQTYAHVVIRDKNNQEKFKKIIPGEKAVLSSDEISFAYDDTIEIYHAEPSRIRLTEDIVDLFNNSTPTNKLQITEYGLMNLAVASKDAQTLLLSRIERAATALRNDYKMLHIDYAEANNDLYLAINVFPSPQREALLAQYADCFVDNRVPQGSADMLVGDMSNNTHLVDHRSDCIIETENGGVDTVLSSVSYTLGQHVENLTLIGEYAVRGVGNALNNHLLGNASKNILVAWDGDDILDGCANNDVLVGGRGNDIYRFARTGGSDFIFEDDSLEGNLDILELGANIDETQLWFSRTGNDLTVSIIGTHDKVTIKNHYYDWQHQVEQFKTVAGKVLTVDKVDALVEVMARHTPPAFGQTTLSEGVAAELRPVLAASWS